MPITRSQSGQTQPLLSSVTPNMDQNQPFGMPFNPSSSPFTQNCRQQSQAPPVEPIMTTELPPTDPPSQQRPPTPVLGQPSTFFSMAFHRGPTGFREPGSPDNHSDNAMSPLQGQDPLGLNKAQSHALEQIFQNFGLTLSQALAASSRNNSQGGTTVKINNPDEFTGDDPTMLRNFLGQCKMVFHARPQAFSSDTEKITLITSYFRKTTQEWWQPYILDPPDPLLTFTSNYLDFLDELHAQFGEIDPSGEAAHKLDNLTMKDHHQAAKYSIQFTTIATQTQFDQAALHHLFYAGLAPRLKNELAHLIYPPRTLLELRVAVLQIDSNYWKRKMERKREDPSANTTQSLSKKKSDSKSSLTSNPKGQLAKGKVPSGIVSVLGSDGHLLPAE